MKKNLKLIWAIINPFFCFCMAIIATDLVIAALDSTNTDEIIPLFIRNLEKTIEVMWIVITTVIAGDF